MKQTGEDGLPEAKILKAYYHFYLFQLYGPIPIVDVNLPISATEEEVRIKRDKVETVVNYIVNLIDEATGDLPLKIQNEATEMGRLTQPGCLGYQSQNIIAGCQPTLPMEIQIMPISKTGMENLIFLRNIVPTNGNLLRTLAKRHSKLL